MFFIWQLLVFGKLIAKLTDIQSKVAVIPTLQADMTLVKEKLKI